ncbi:hypothetical protein [Kribbella sp. NPDC049584]|uniref:hypothetical protein n=1 Tax=Kribbella sp. NPDC049584 TaxID=3154833 RepID=UPI00342488CB
MVSTDKSQSIRRRWLHRASAAAIATAVLGVGATGISVAVVSSKNSDRTSNSGTTATSSSSDDSNPSSSDDSGNSSSSGLGSSSSGSTSQGGSNGS